MPRSVVVALVVLVALSVIVLLARRHLGAAVMLAVLAVLVAAFARPLEIAWDGMLRNDELPPGSSAPARGTVSNRPPPDPPSESPSLNRPTPKTSPSSPRRQPPDESLLPDVTPSRAPETVYLSAHPRSDGGRGIVEEGAVMIKGREYLHSIVMCSELSLIPNINCNSDRTETWSAEYVAPPDTRSFAATIGLTDRSSSDCRVWVQVQVDGVTKFESTLVAGARYDRRWSVGSGTRVIYRSRPVAGEGRCFAALGNARFTP